MLKTIEIRLTDEAGNYSKATIEYKGYVDMLVDHNIDMMHDTLQAMVENYTTLGAMEIKKDAIAKHESKVAPHKQ